MHGKLTVAHATQETILSEKKLVSKCIQEAKLCLRSWYDAAERTETRLNLAEEELDAILKEMRSLGWMSMNTSGRRPAVVSEPWLEDTWSCESNSKADMG